MKSCAGCWPTSIGVSSSTMSWATALRGGGDFDEDEDEQGEADTEPDFLEGLDSSAIDIAVTNEVLGKCLEAIKEIALRHGDHLREELEATRNR